MKERNLLRFIGYFGSLAVIVILFYSLKLPLWAASLSFSPQSGSYSIGQTIGVSVYVNSAGQAMNAVSGVISFPPDLLQAISISKSGSILSLWAEEPTFSNGNGTVNFGGVALSPGYTGSFGKVITVYFKVKGSGISELLLSSASVLANDGQGTNILNGVGKANYTLKSATLVPSKSPIIKIAKPPPLKDTTPPINLSVQQIPSDDTTNPIIHLSLKADDPQSGIDYFEIQTDNNDGTKIEKSNEYASLPLAYGRHTFFVRVFDRAGNFSDTSVHADILPLTAPVITYFQPTINNGSPLVIKGTTKYPNSEVTLKFKPYDDYVKNLTVSTDQSGNFVFVYPNDLKNGTYEIKAMVTDSRGAKSEDTNPISITVQPSPVALIASKTTNVLFVAVPLIALIIILILLLSYGWHSLISIKKKVSKESLEAQEAVNRSFGRVMDTVRNQIAFLEKIEIDRNLTDGERHFLNKMKDDIEGAQKEVKKEVDDLTQIK